MKDYLDIGVGKAIGTNRDIQNSWLIIFSVR